MPSKPILRQTPSQTIGPFFAQGLTAAQSDYPFDSIIDNTITGPGQAVHIQGRVFDGEGKVVDDALIEIWQANAAGRSAAIALTSNPVSSTICSISKATKISSSTIKTLLLIPGACMI